MTETAADTDTGANTPPQEAAHWKAWKQMCRAFPTWSFILSGLFTPGAWTTIGNDLISGLRANPSTKKAHAITADLSDEDLERLMAIALLNQRRHDWVIRVLVIGYVTAPLTLIAIVAEVAGTGLLELARNNVVALANMSGAVVLAVLTYTMSQWRARQMVGVLELIRIDRGLPARD